jgi:hypothetical protein
LRRSPGESSMKIFSKLTVSFLLWLVSIMIG